MYSWNDFINDFPYTNFSDINVSWFLNKFKQIFDEWEGLYNQMLSWKTATDEYNATWRTEQEQAFTTWENNFQTAIDAWKAQTESDIGTWETDTIASLEAWKAVFINQYNALKLEVEQIADDAEAAKNSAQASATSAANSADSASATALALQASLEQIDTNTDDISELKTQINNVVKIYVNIEEYFYKENTYIRTGVETTLNGYDTYYVPLGPLDYAEILWDPNNPFYGQLTVGYVFNLKNSDDTISQIGVADRSENYGSYIAKGIVGFRGKTIKGFFFTVKEGLEDALQFVYNQKNITLKDFKQTNTIEILKDNTPYSNSMVYFSNYGELGVIQTEGDWYIIKMPVNSGDKFIFDGTPSGFGYYGTVLYDGGYDVITTENRIYTVLHDGVIGLNNSITNHVKTMYIPINSPKTYSENIFGGNPYSGKKGVAFGTSLTYRGQAGQTGGYLNYLHELTEMTWDNQGVGSSTIYGNASTTILNEIIAYNDYADKDVVIIEGFVNDFYTECPLGVYTDTGTASVCGCLRSAIAHILTEKKTATIFVVLDHYGKGITAEDVVKGGETQYSYYEECAKVCESMGVYAIKEYALSGFNSYSDQFLLDNIHCNDLGAKQSAQTIWDYMKTHLPKVQS